MNAVEASPLLPITDGGAAHAAPLDATVGAAAWDSVVPQASVHTSFPCHGQNRERKDHCTRAEQQHGDKQQK